MDAAEKGARYAKIFRKAGALLAKGRIARALVAFEEGRAFAAEQGDRAMERRFAAEIQRANTMPPASDD
jgi:hypothetical protein